jgi:hypothetical protein
MKKRMTRVIEPLAPAVQISGVGEGIEMNH